MTSRFTARLLASLAVVAIVAAACGGSSASTGPTTAAATPTAVPVTQGPVATSNGSEPTFDLSSFHADVDLEKLIPTSIGGVPVTPLSISGADLTGENGSPELAAMLTALGKQASDVSAAFGYASAVSVTAFKINGVSGSAMLTALFNAYNDLASSTVTDVSYGGKAVKKVTPADPDEDVMYVYASQDVVFAVGGPDATAALLNEVFSKLP